MTILQMQSGQQRLVISMGVNIQRLLTTFFFFSTHITFSVYLTACYGNDTFGNTRFKIGIYFDIHIVL